MSRTIDWGFTNMPVDLLNFMYCADCCNKPNSYPCRACQSNKQTIEGLRKELRETQRRWEISMRLNEEFSIQLADALILDPLFVEALNGEPTPHALEGK